MIFARPHAAALCPACQAGHLKATRVNRYGFLVAFFGVFVFLGGLLGSVVSLLLFPIGIFFGILAMILGAALAATDRVLKCSHCKSEF